MNSKPKSALSKLMTRGHEKVNYKDRQGKVLMALSEEDHKRIAKLIAKWLESPVQRK